MYSAVAASNVQIEVQELYLMKESIDSVPELAASGQTRRQLLTTVGAGALATVAMMAISKWSYGDSDDALTDTDILNFALNLEYLEAEFYTYATTGKGLEAAGIGVHGMGNFGPTYGGSMVDFSAIPGLDTIAAQIAADEQTHVSILRDALGANHVAKPTIDLDALGIGFGNASDFLVVARAFEDTGVSAYTGAASAISSTYIEVAAQILGIEAYHASNIRLLIAQNGISTSPLDSKDILPPPSGTDFFFESGALTVPRTPHEVLAIAYGGSGKFAGGFFPAGVNGDIHFS
jgi:hypothetical protein